MAEFAGYIGGYTMKGGAGVYRFALNGDSGAISIAEAGEAFNPSYLAFSTDKAFLYAVNEGGDFEGVPGGGVTAWRRAAADGSLQKAGERSVGGGHGPCHLTQLGDYLYVANYGDGTVSVFPLEGGVPQKCAQLVKNEGKGPDARRQEHAHAHCAVAVPGAQGAPDAQGGGGLLCIVDLGIDQALFFKAGADGKLALDHSVYTDGGAGPRHIVFAPDGSLAWLVTELSNEVYTLAPDKATGKWAVTSKVSTLPAGFSGNSACAAIRLSPDGKRIVASNRFHDSVADFAIRGADGSLSLEGVYPVGGKTPRDIAFSPDGRWLVCANQDSGTTVVLAAQDGFRVAATSEGAKMPTAVLFE